MSGTTVFVGGSIGSDPYNPRTWSGSSPLLLNALSSRGLLDKAAGVKLSRLTHTLLLAKNFHPTRSIWRSHFYLDLAYRRAMTQAARRISVDGPFCLQLGHWYNLPSVFADKKCLSYHDGNLAVSLNSGFGMNGISAKRIDEAMHYEEQATQQMAAVLTFSEHVRLSFVRDYHVAGEKIFNVGGGVNLTEIPAVLPKDYDAPRVLFIGIEFRRKGGEQLLNAFKIVRESIPSAELHIVGPDRMNRVPTGVIFHGRLSKADPTQNAKLKSIFRACNLFVLPSLYEPFGIAPLEAMLYRIPCILTNAWTFPEFVKPGVSGELVEKISVEDLATKMKALLAAPDKLAAMGNAAREHVLSRFTWPAVAERIANVLESL